jgi:hypothetical protein
MLQVREQEFERFYYAYKIINNYSMKKNYLIALCLSFGLILSCNSPKNYIIATDVEKIALNASKNGLTVEENGRLGLLIHCCPVKF